MSNNLEEKIEKILTELENTVSYDSVQRVKSHKSGVSPKVHHKKALGTLYTLINQKEKELLEKFDEVIGKDENLDKAIFGGVLAEQLKGQKGLMTSYEIARNRLRAEQRDRIKQLKEELKEKQL